MSSQKDFEHLTKKTTENSYQDECQESAIFNSWVRADLQVEIWVFNKLLPYSHSDSVQQVLWTLACTFVIVWKQVFWCRSYNDYVWIQAEHKSGKTGENKVDSAKLFVFSGKGTAHFDIKGDFQGEFVLADRENKREESRDYWRGDGGRGELQVPIVFIGDFEEHFLSVEVSGGNKKVKEKEKLKMSLWRTNDNNNWRINIINKLRKD